MNKLYNRFSTPLRGKRMLAAVIACISPVLFAQETTTGEDEDVFELSPFVVSTNDDVGYQSTNSNSITRLDEKLKNLPMSVEVFNTEFIEDIAAIDIVDVVAYSTGASFTEDTNEREINFRGMNSRFNRRNQFIWYNPSDGFSIGRVEVIRGPQSLLYGQAEPGGLVNTTSKTAIYNSNFGKVKTRNDSWGTARGEVDYNLGMKNVAFRVAGVLQNRKDWRENGEDRLAGTYLTGSWRFLNNTTTLRFEYEDAVRDADPVLGWIEQFGGVQIPLATDANGNSLYDVTPLTKDNSGTWGGLDNRFKRSWTSQTIFLESTPKSWLSLQIAYSRQEQDQDKFAMQNANIIRFGNFTDDATGEVFTDDYFVRLQRQQSLNGNEVDTLRATASIQFDAIAKHNLILGAQTREDYFWLTNYQERYNDGKARNGARRQLEFALANGNEFRFSEVPQEVADQYVFKLQTTIYNEELTDSYFAALSSKWKIGNMEDRLHTIVGYRTDDYVKNNLGNGAVDDKGRVPTRNFGAVFQINDAINVYGNYSQSFKAPGASRRDTELNTLTSALGDGMELGLKFDLFDNRVSGLLTYFNVALDGDQVRLSNAQRDAADPNGLNGRNNPAVPWIMTDTESNGIELQFVANLAEGWTTRFGYSYIDSTVNNQVSAQANFNDGYLADAAGNPVDEEGNAIMVDGVAVTVADFEIDSDNGSIVNFTELGLVGNGVTGSKTLQYSGAATPIIILREEGEKLEPYSQHQINIVSNYNFRDGKLKGFSAGGALRWRKNNYAGYTGSTLNGDRAMLTNPDYTIVDLFLGYKKSWKSVTWNSKLNFQNLFDKEYYSGRYYVRYGNPRIIVWSNTISF